MPLTAKYYLCHLTDKCLLRYPRNCLLNFASDFLTKCSVKLNEINKKSAQEKNLELLDQKCFIKLNEVVSAQGSCIAWVFS